MLSAILLLSGLFLSSAQNVIVVVIGIGLIILGAYLDGAFYGMRKAIKKKKSCHRPK